MPELLNKILHFFYSYNPKTGSVIGKNIQKTIQCVKTFQKFKNPCKKER